MTGTIKLIFKGDAIKSKVYMSLQDRKGIIEKWKKEYGWFEVQIKPDVDYRHVSKRGRDWIMLKAPVWKSRRSGASA